MCVSHSAMYVALMRACAILWTSASLHGAAPAPFPLQGGPLPPPTHPPVWHSQDLHKAKGHVMGVVFGFVAILFLTPLLGFAMREIPLEPKLFSIGELSSGGAGCVLDRNRLLSDNARSRMHVPLAEGRVTTTTTTTGRGMLSSSCRPGATHSWHCFHLMPACCLLSGRSVKENKV